MFQVYHAGVDLFETEFWGGLINMTLKKKKRQPWSQIDFHTLSAKLRTKESHGFQIKFWGFFH